MPNTSTASMANMWVNIEPLTDGRCELVLNALGATERRIPFDTEAQALQARSGETIRYMDAVTEQRQARA